MHTSMKTSINAGFLQLDSRDVIEIFHCIQQGSGQTGVCGRVLHEGRL